MRVRDRVHAFWSAIRAEVGLDEAMMALGMACVTAGLWPILHQVALVVPGAVLLWLGLPTRAPFTEPKRSDETLPKRDGRTTMPRG